jgi:hypothetical protein
LVSASDDVTVECLGAEVKVFTADVSDDQSQSLVNAIGSGNVVGAVAAAIEVVVGASVTTVKEAGKVIGKSARRSMM